MTFQGRSHAEIRAALAPFLADVRAGLEVGIRAAYAPPDFADATTDFALFVRDAAAHVRSQIAGWQATHSPAVRTGITLKCV